MPFKQCILKGLSIRKQKKMNSIINFLSSLKLTLLQWIAISLAAIVGGLVALLKIQGGRLHAAQVAVLKANMANYTERSASARIAYNQAKMAYEKASN